MKLQVLIIYSLVQMMYTMLFTKIPHFVVIHKKNMAASFCNSDRPDKHAIDLIDKESVL